MTDTDAPDYARLQALAKRAGDRGSAVAIRPKDFLALIAVARECDATSRIEELTSSANGSTLVSETNGRRD